MAGRKKRRKCSEQFEVPTRSSARTDSTRHHEKINIVSNSWGRTNFATSDAEHSLCDRPEIG